MTTETAERTQMEPGTAFDTVTTALAGLYDTAHEMRAWPVVSEVRRLLIASYELLRNGLVGDRSQQLAAALAACSGRQPTILAARGMWVDLISGAPLQSEGIDLNAALLLCMAAQHGIHRRRCERARSDTVAWLWPDCRHPWCAVAAQVDRMS